MEKHRVMSCDSTYGNPLRCFFVEVEPDSWAELSGDKIVTHKDIHMLLGKEKVVKNFTILKMSTSFLIAESKALKTNLREEKPII